MMKKIFISFLISLFFITYTFAIEKIYYCIETASTGFDVADNFEQKKYKPKRFKAEMDFEREHFSSPDIFMTNTNCSYMIAEWSHTMQCYAPYGSMFVINTNNLKFTTFDSIGIAGNNNDDIAIAHGQCEEF